MREWMSMTWLAEEQEKEYSKQRRQHTQISGHYREPGIFGGVTRSSVWLQHGKRRERQVVGLVSRRGQVVKCFVYHANGGVIFFGEQWEPLKGAWRPVRGLWNSQVRDYGGLNSTVMAVELREMDRLRDNQEVRMLSLSLVFSVVWIPHYRPGCRLSA